MQRICLYICCLALLLSSCKKYLDEKLISGVSYDYYDTEDGIEDAVNSAYAELRYPLGREHGFALSEYGTDEFTEGADGSQKATFNQYNTTLNANSGWLHDIWTSYYRGVSITNLCISRIPAINGVNFYTNDANRNMRLGEMRFIRAYCYFMLVQTWGRVPLLLEENIGVQTDFKRAEVSQVYDAIISDLRFAVDHLPATQGDYGRATRGAARHLLAKVYLTRGSAVTDQRGQKATDMDSVIYYGDQVISSGNYALVENYARLWDMNNQKNSEVVFAIQFSKNLLINGDGNRLHLYFGMEYDILPGMQRDVANGRPFKRLRPTDFLMDAYDRKNDSRFYKSFKWAYLCNNEANRPKWDASNAPDPSLVGKPKFNLGDTAVYVSMDRLPDNDPQRAQTPYLWISRTQFNPKWYPTLIKFLDPERPDKTEERGSRDFFLMRLAETYLMVAEAYGRKGDFTKAAEYINIVRKRAAYHEGEVKPAQYYLVEGGDPADLTKSTEPLIMVTPTDISNDFVNFMLTERMLELHGECMRWHDLVRTEKLVERVKEHNREAANIRDFHKLRPIPQAHIERLGNPGPKEEEQNPGYY
ncbi:RagB/SusD family nutrient uptake outer membrane protein [Chitinophaga japonensis]|uniref:Putative outer membrane starch-binding protein n=1 Tax=Chitinophaga japonensis TaxID=104662 RepID=A0A562TCU8_CHIJA|nr:RagB/SusD family nutrient uptake outer membrane protein [Chitinophaga japonensis]TWI91074.1 putative outer membrane starch-binding protein [Chitinophaga japonensis]